MSFAPMVGEFDGKNHIGNLGSCRPVKNQKLRKAKKAEEEGVSERAGDADIAKLVLAFKDLLGDAVKDVKPSERLTDSAVCLVAGEGDMDLHLERMLKCRAILMYRVRAG